MTDSTPAAASGLSGLQIENSTRPGRRRFCGVLAAGVVMVVIAGVVLLRSGGGGARRLFPAPGEVVRALNERALKVSRIHDFTIGPDDTMFVAVSDDKGDRDLLSVSPSGKISTLLRTKGKNAVHASAIALGGNGELYVADAGRDRIVVRAKNGKIREIGSFAPAAGASDTDPGLDRVERIALDAASGDVYLADEDKIDRLDRDGQLSTVAGARRAYGDKSDFPPDSFVPDHAAPKTGSANSLRFFRLEGLAFNPDDASLYVTTSGFALVRIGKDGAAEVVPSHLRFGGSMFYDSTRKNLYVGAQSPSRDGIARVNKDRDILVLSGSEGSTYISDHIAADSRGNLYWLHEASGAITASGDALTETRVDLKGLPRKPAAPSKSPGSGGVIKELFDATSVVTSLGSEIKDDDLGPLAAGRDGTVYFAINGDNRTSQDDRLIAVPRSEKPEVLTEKVPTSAVAVSDDGTLYAAQWGQHHALYFRRAGRDWRPIVDYRPQYSQQDPEGNSLASDPSVIAIDEASKDIYLSDGQQITRVDPQGRLNRVAGGPRAPDAPLPPQVADGTPARDAQFGFIADLAVDPTSHDLYIQNGQNVFRLGSDGSIHAVTDPATGYPLPAPHNGFGFDSQHRSLLVSDYSKPQPSIASVSVEGKISPIPATAGQVGQDDRFWATSDGAIYIWGLKTGKVRYLGPGT